MPFKDRTTNDTLPSHSTSVVKTGTGITCNNSTMSAFSYGKTYEAIADSGRGSTRENECDHYKITKTLTEAPFSYATSTHSSPHANYCTWTHNRRRLRWDQQSHGFGQYGQTDLPSVDARLYPGLSNLIAHSHVSMLPAIRPELSLLNSIYELKDFKRLPKLLTRVKGFIGALPSWLRRRRTRATLRELTRLGSEGYLTDQFALRPLLSDMTSLYQASLSVHDAVEGLLRNEGKKKRRYFSTTISDHWVESDVSTSALAGAGQYGGNIHRRIVSYPLVPTFRAVMEYEYHFTDFERNNAELLGTLDSLGVQLNPQIIWNAIPWSFAIDWVLGVNQWLGQFQWNNLAPVTFIHKYVWSIQLTRQIECRTHYSIGGPVSTDVLVQTITENSYYRRPQSVDWNQAIKSSGLNPKEFSYIGALIGAKLA